ncbi:MAG: prolipoprotein diacylglyceryl transferase [Chloroflexi bacterium]|nr:prolipoprotein diacylglyceryl transferase [Chloroflexota bacterium]
MLPILQLGPLALPTYPLGLLIAGWIALAVGAWAGTRRGLDGDHIYNAGLYGLLGGLVIGRLGHVIAFWPAYRTQPLEIVGLNTAAFLLGPAVLGGLLAAGGYVYRRKLPAATVLDAAAPGVLAGLVIADLAALLGGQMTGAPAAVPWAINVWGVARHPVQLYEALAGLITLAAVGSVVKRGSRPGIAAWVAVLGYGLSRWLLEPFRAESAIILGGLRVAQVLGLAAALLALWMLRMTCLALRKVPGT